MVICVTTAETTSKDEAKETDNNEQLAKRRILSKVL
jgi:hypothetical protein